MFPHIHTHILHPYSPTLHLLPPSSIPRTYNLFIHTSSHPIPPPHTKYHLLLPAPTYYPIAPPSPLIPLPSDPAPYLAGCCKCPFKIHFPSCILWSLENSVSLHRWLELMQSLMQYAGLYVEWLHLFRFKSCMQANFDNISWFFSLVCTCLRNLTSEVAYIYFIREYILLKKMILWNRKSPT